MNIYALVNGLNAICSLSIAIILLFNRKTQKRIQVIGAAFYFLVFLWAFLYFVWGIQSSLEKSLFWLRALEYPICFIHIAYFQFSLTFAGQEKKYSRHIIAGYALGVLFVLMNYFKLFYDYSYIRN